MNGRISLLVSTGMKMQQILNFLATQMTYLNYVCGLLIVGRPWHELVCYPLSLCIFHIWYINLIGSCLLSLDPVFYTSVGRNNCWYSSNPRRVGIYNTYTWASRWASIHMGSIYTNTPRSLNYRHSGVQDWTIRKPTPPAPQSELPAQRCSRLDKKRVQREYKGLIPPAATTSHRLR